MFGSGRRQRRGSGRWIGLGESVTPIEENILLRSSFWMSPLGGTTHLGDSLGGDADERGLADNRGHL